MAKKMSPKTVRCGYTVETSFNMNDAQLLQRFAEQNSEAAFRALVERHLPLVFGTARRMTGDSALAEDIAQTVFILLARKGNRLGSDIILSGWLHRTTRFVTARALAAEWRRRRREQEAVIMQPSQDSNPCSQRLSPNLDDALAQLGETDRNAILLRYFEQQSLREVGLSLGLREEAAKKRVARALEKLRRMLRRRGAEISAAALVAGLTETAEAASVIPLAGKVSAVVIAQQAAAAGASAGSALLSDVLAALRWEKVLKVSGAVIGLLAVTLLLPLAGHYWQRPGNSFADNSNSSALAPGSEPRKRASRFATSSNNAAESRTLRVTVLDAQTGEPIQGAILTPYVNGVTVPEFQNPFKTGSGGVVKLPIPMNAPGGERGDYCEIPVNATGYTTRVMRWSSETGMVLNVVSSAHTVQLTRGITLSGTVVDDFGRPLAGIRVSGLGNNCDGGTRTMPPDGNWTPAVHQEDYSTYFLPREKSPVITDTTGRFKLENYPGDVRALQLELLGADGVLHKFQTPEGFVIHAETLPKVDFAELKNGSASLVIPEGVTVQGIVLNHAGSPIAGAHVVEATQRGNLEILSRIETDSAGRFFLSNRPLHRIILGVSADGSASLSAILNIKAGMEPIQLRLPPELPLRGQVVNERGFPITEARVETPDWLNPGECLEWGVKAGADGRFKWVGAPTNEVALRITASGYAPRVVKLRASSSESLIRLHLGDNDPINVTGHVTDAVSGARLDHFQIKISHQMMVGDIPQGPTQDFDGSNGEINIELSRKDFPVGFGEAWIMTIEADGYDSFVSRHYEREEGDQQLDFKLKPGGTVQGVIRTPAGEPAASAQLAFTIHGDAAIPCSKPGQLSPQDLKTETGGDGQFKLKKPLLASNLVIFHDTGWSVVPVTTGAQKAEITLSAWGRVEGTVSVGTKPAAGRNINLEHVKQEALAIFYHTTTDNEGHFVFDKMPSGVFKLSCGAMESGRWNVATLQTYVTVKAGEIKSVEMAASGRTVSAQIQGPPRFGTINWSNALATLTTDIQIPSEPAQHRLTSSEGSEPGRLPGYQKTFAGSIGEDGVAVFQQVAPGNYVLEVKLFDPSKRASRPSLDNEPAVVIARLRAPITVPEAPSSSDGAATAGLGDYYLRPL